MRATPERDRIVLTLPLPPSMNRIWRKNSRTKGGVYRSPQYMAWLTEAWAVLPRPVPKIKGPYRLTIEAVRPDNRKRDIGNLEKPLSDFLVSQGVVEDDSLATSITMAWLDQTDGFTGCFVVIESDPVSGCVDVKKREVA